MASVHKHTRGGWYLSLYLYGRRHRLYLGKLSKAQAHTVARRVAELVAATETATDPVPAAEQWASNIGPNLREKLVACGLRLPTVANAMSLSEYWNHYTAGRTDWKSDSTRRGFAVTLKHALHHLGDKTMAEITVADAKQMMRSLAATYSEAHASKLLERTRQVFADALDAQAIPANPFDGLRLRFRVRREKKQYVSVEDALLVIENCSNQHARALFAVGRFGGVRLPHEALSLRWADIDWERGRLKIDKETKTGSRVLPLFPVLRREIDGLLQLSDGSNEYVFDRARSSAETTWRNWHLEAIAKSQLDAWPKLWTNLRASCRTDLRDKFPDAVCNAWLGHGSRVALEHYEMVTEKHWEQSQQVFSKPAHD